MTKLRKGTGTRLVRRERVTLPVAGVPRTAIRKITSDSLSERVYQSLKRDIITGVHQAGEALSEKDLAEKYASSRTPVREAAVRLQHDNLLRVVPNRGYFITKISVQDFDADSRHTKTRLFQLRFRICNQHRMRRQSQHRACPRSELS